MDSSSAAQTSTGTPAGRQSHAGRTAASSTTDAASATGGFAVASATWDFAVASAPARGGAVRFAPTAAAKPVRADGWCAGAIGKASKAQRPLGFGCGNCGRHPRRRRSVLHRSRPETIQRCQTVGFFILKQLAGTILKRLGGIILEQLGGTATDVGHFGGVG